LILGIDPGLSGALAIYDSTHRKLVDVVDMPLTKFKDKKSSIDTLSLTLFLARYAKSLRFAVVEEVSAMPGQGVVSMFRFGESVGILKGMLSTYFVPTHFVRPQVWKLTFNLSSDKNLSRERAAALFPDGCQANPDPFGRKKDDGRAEASLLAVWGSLYRG
jgi:crossover junction endodeoxyribonuclease RuvC